MLAVGRGAQSAIAPFTTEKVERRHGSQQLNAASENAAASDPYPEVELDREQMTLAFRILRQVPQAQTARRRILNSLLGEVFEFYVNEERRMPNAHFLELYQRHWKPFFMQWYDWYMAVGVVPVRLVTLANGDRVPRVPGGVARLHVFYDSESDCRRYKYYRMELVGPKRGQWLYDEDVYVLSGYGHDPDENTGVLASPLSTLIDDVFFANASQILRLKALIKASNPQMWLEDHASVEVPRDQVDDIRFYGRSNGSNGDGDDDDDVLHVPNSEETLDKKRRKRMQSTAALVESDDYERIWRSSLLGKPLALTTAAGVLSSEQAQVPRPLPAETRVVQRQQPSENAHYVEEQRLVNEKISATFGVSADMLSAGASSARVAGNLEGVDETLHTTLVALKDVCGEVASTLYRVLYWPARRAASSRILVDLMEQRERPLITSEDVFRAYQETNVTLRFPSTLKTVTLEDSVANYAFGLMSYEELWTQQRRRLGFEAASPPPQPWPELLRMRLFHARSPALTLNTPLDYAFMTAQPEAQAPKPTGELVTPLPAEGKKRKAS